MPAKGIFKKKHTQKNLKELKLKLKSCIKKVKSYIKLYKKVKKKNHEEKPILYVEWIKQKEMRIKED